MNIRCLKPRMLLPVAFSLCLLTLFPAHGVRINFAAVLTPATCELSLDKSSVYLGSVSLSALSVGNVVALPQPFTLQVRQCDGVVGGDLKPMVRVTGEGFAASGDNKWLFRSADSQAIGIGILLTQGDTPPEYGQKEVKNGDYLSVGPANVVPVDTDLPLYVGVSCGSNTACRSSAIKPGRLTARIIFDFTYR
ncbi:fimbrial protein [Serratia sp. NPDC078593]|uniref:fimbrial protein n=1 Tax=unclassified Serratia (in: enterobacteria) TaxID=2647522 RepID=UPI0037CE1E3B